MEQGAGQAGQAGPSAVQDPDQTLPLSRAALARFVASSQSFL